MQKTNDIATLFQQFGGSPDSYQEISRQQHSQAARTRWPLLAKIDGVGPEVIPPVQNHERLPAQGVPLQSAAPPPPPPPPPAPSRLRFGLGRAASGPAEPAQRSPLEALRSVAAPAPMPAPVPAPAPAAPLPQSHRAVPTAPAPVPAPVLSQGPATSWSAHSLVRGSASPLSRLVRRSDMAPPPAEPEERAPSTDVLQHIFSQLAGPGKPGTGP